MTREQLDVDTFEGTIVNGGAETLTVDTTRAENLLILIDDGTTGNQPSQYTLTQRVLSTEFSDFFFYDQVTGSTARSFADPAWGDDMEVEIENTSGADDTYRITVKSYRKLD